MRRQADDLATIYTEAADVGPGLGLFFRILAWVRLDPWTCIAGVVTAVGSFQQLLNILVSLFKMNYTEVALLPSSFNNLTKGWRLG